MKLDISEQDGMRIIPETVQDRHYLREMFHLTYPHNTAIEAVGSWMSGDSGTGIIRLNPIPCHCVEVIKGETDLVACPAHPAERR